MDIVLIVLTYFLLALSASSFGYYLGHLRGYSDGIDYSELWAAAYADGWDAAEADIRLQEFYKSLSTERR